MRIARSAGPCGSFFPLVIRAFLIFLRAVRIFVGVEDIPVVVHPAVAVGGGVEFHFFGKGVDVFVLAGDEEVVFVADLGVGAAAVFHDLVGHLVDVTLGVQGHFSPLIHGPGDRRDPLGIQLDGIKDHIQRRLPGFKLVHRGPEMDRVFVGPHKGARPGVGDDGPQYLAVTLSALGVFHQHGHSIIPVRLESHLLELLVDLLICPVDGFHHFPHGILGDDLYLGRLGAGGLKYLGQELFRGGHDLDRHALVILARLKETEAGWGIGKVGIIPARGEADHDRSPVVFLDHQVTLGSNGVSRAVLGQGIDVEDAAFEIPFLGNQKGKGLFIGLPGALHEKGWTLAGRRKGSRAGGALDRGAGGAPEALTVFPALWLPSGASIAGFRRKGRWRGSYRHRRSGKGSAGAGEHPGGG